MRKKIKVYYSTADVAEMLGMTTDGARQWLQRNKVGRKVGGRWKCTIDQIAAVFPEAYQNLPR